MNIQRTFLDNPRNGEHEPWRRYLHHLGDVDARDDDAALVRAAEAERRARRYSTARAQRSPPGRGIGRVGASMGSGCGIWMLSHGAVGCGMRSPAARDSEGASEGAAVGQGLDGAAAGKSSKGVAAMASGTANPPGKLHGGALLPPPQGVRWTIGRRARR